VRPWFTSLALALLLIPSPCRADVFDETDGKDAKKADPKHGEDDARREQQLWEAYVKKLGDGPIYRVEVLYRGGPGADHITYCRHYISAVLPKPRGLFGFGVNAKGEVTPPADPGREAVKAALEVRKGGKSQLPLATRTHHIGIALDSPGPGCETIAIRRGDVGALAVAPKKRGEPELFLYERALFRVERVTHEDVLKMGPLRQDAKLCRERIDALHREALSVVRERLKQNGRELVLARRELVQATYLFRDSELLDCVRKVLADWTPPAPTEVVVLPFPTSVADCLADLGDERDFAAFHRLKKLCPDDAKCLLWATPRLIERVGAAKAMPLIEDLLNNPTPLDADGRIEVLRELDPRIPEFTDGDLFLIETVRHFRLKATCYELRPVQRTLDALQKTRPLTPEQNLKLATCHYSDHLFLTEAARRQGVELVLDWFKQYQPPANK